MTGPIDLVTNAQVAEMCGVGDSAPRTWRTRHADYPEPYVKGYWLRADIEAWCRKHGALPLLDGHLYDDNGYDVTESVAS